MARNAKTTDPKKLCPKCGNKMAATHSNPIANLVEQYRTCKSCSYRDRAILEPARILRTISVLPHDK